MSTARSTPGGMHKANSKTPPYFVAFTVDFAHLKQYSSKHKKGRRQYGRRELIMTQIRFNDSIMNMSFRFTMAREMFAGLYYRTLNEKLSV